MNNHKPQMNTPCLAGLMQDVPLTISSLLEHAALNHGSTNIIARLNDGSLFRYDYHTLAERSRQAANALRELGMGVGDVVATLAWNHHWHMECFYSIPGLGAICHTVNPRLHQDQIVYIINHAKAKILMLDQDSVPLLESIANQLLHIEHIIILGAQGCLAEPAGLGEVLYYEELIAQQPAHIDWPEFDERIASGLCYTSGTTGNPKGVLYSHRSTVLHSLAIAQPDNFCLSCHDCVMPAAPLYHAQSWGLPYGACMVGAKFVLPGRHLDGPHLLQLIREEGVTIGCGVPTVWTSVLEQAEPDGVDLSTLNTLLVGGTALPSSLRQRFLDKGVDSIQIWGMTETSPLGTIAKANRQVSQLSSEALSRQQMKQGRIPYGVQIKITLPDGSVAPRDGNTAGDIWIKGPWVASGYLHGEGGELLDAEGFFPTGDVGHIDPNGYLKITDRSKDVIKSGGEWISSIDIEDIALRHPAVHMAAVVAAYHPKWNERPLLIVTLKEQQALSKQQLLDHLSGKIAKWWMPDDVLVIEAMPMTATGKIRKATLREQYWHYLSEK